MSFSHPFPPCLTTSGPRPPTLPCPLACLPSVLALSVVLVGPLSDLLGAQKSVAGRHRHRDGRCNGLPVFQRIPAGFWVFRVIQAVGCGSFVLSQALIQDLFAGREQERMRIWMMTGGGIFISISPLLGTWLQIASGLAGQLLCFYHAGGHRLAEDLARCWKKPRAIAKRRPDRFFSAYGLAVLGYPFHGLLADLGAGLCLPFFIYRHLADHFHGAAESSRPTNLRGLYCCMAWPMCSVGLSPAPCIGACRPTSQIIIGLGLIALSGLVMLWLANQFDAYGLRGADPHADLHGRHHHRQAYRQLQSHEPLPTGCRYVAPRSAG